MSSATLNEQQGMYTKETTTPPANSQATTITPSRAESQEKVVNQLPAKATSLDHYDYPLAKLGQVRKNILLTFFSIAGFVDVCNVSGVAIAVAQISADINLDLSQIVWIITSYSLCFAAFMLFAGRLSDLFPAQIIFEGGFIALGIISLITSFVTTNKFGFLILRGIGGICGAMTIPSSYHLVVHMFPDPTEQQAKLALLGVAAILGNILGLVLAGVTMLASYHWFFRLMAILCLVFGGLTMLLLPHTGSSYVSDGTPRWKLLDVPGVVLMMGALICFILSLTQGPIDGWGSASFIAPFILAFVLGVGFFVWEAKIPAKTAVLPSSVWKITNIVIYSIGIGIPLAFFSTSQLQYSTYFQRAFGWTPIHVAAAILPQGIVGLLMGIAVQFFPQIITKPRISIPIAAVLIIVALILQIFSYGGAGMDYWRYCFPAFLLGSAGAVVTFMATSINVVTYCPPSMSGIAGAWTQVVSQTAAAVVLAVQAGLEGDDLFDWMQSSARAWYFQIGWTALLALIFVVFYKTPGTPEEEHAACMKRIEESDKDTGLLAPSQ